MPGEGLTPDLINELEQYRRILNNIPAEIGVLDPEGRYLFNTPSGITDPQLREWMLGKTNHEWVRKRGHPTEIADQRQAAVDHCVAEKEAVTFEEIWTDKRGHRLHYVRTFSPVQDEAGTVTHVLGYGQQITELKSQAITNCPVSSMSTDGLDWIFPVEELARVSEPALVPSLL